MKERMAALQGKGAFGAPPPVAPKPSVERPKWKPPPAVQAPADDDDGEGTTSAIAAAVGRTISPPVVKSPESILSEGAESVAAPPATTTEGANEEEATPDPEEEERQRRAAIAARMARLGGARVGMAPPIIGKKPVRRPTQEEELKPAVDELKKVSEEQPTNETTSPEVAKSAEDKASDVAELGSCVYMHLYASRSHKSCSCSWITSNSDVCRSYCGTWTNFRSVIYSILSCR